MAEEKRKNLKAEKFEKYLADNSLNFFQKNETNDESETVVFRSNIQAEGQMLPVGVITDNTIYTIIRVALAGVHVSEENRPAFEEFMNKMNRSFKVFKYVSAEDGTAFLDACIPSSNDSFDPEIVRVVLDVVADHLQQEYKNVMKAAWGN